MFASRPEGGKQQQTESKTIFSNMSNSTHVSLYFLLPHLNCPHFALHEFGLIPQKDAHIIARASQCPQCGNSQEDYNNNGFLKNWRLYQGIFQSDTTFHFSSFNMEKKAWPVCSPFFLHFSRCLLGVFSGQMTERENLFGAMACRRLENGKVLSGGTPSVHINIHMTKCYIHHKFENECV